MIDNTITSGTFWISFATLLISFITSSILCAWKLSAINSETKENKHQIERLEKVQKDDLRQIREGFEKLESMQKDDMREIREKIDKIYEIITSNSR